MSFTVLIWDDEIYRRGPTNIGLSALRLVVREHADDWRSDLKVNQPVAVLLDADMGPAHLRGWQVCRSLRREAPDLPVVCISRNRVARAVMAREGAELLDKEGISRFVTRLDGELARSCSDGQSGNLRHLIGRIIAEMASASN